MVLARLEALAAAAEQSALNRVELRDTSYGVITSGIVYHYVREALPEASVLKLGFTHPFPLETVRQFASAVQRLLVVGIEFGSQQFCEARADIAPAGEHLADGLQQFFGGTIL